MQELLFLFHLFPPFVTSYATPIEMTRNFIFSRHHNSVVSYIHTIILLHVSVHQGPSSGKNPRKIQKSFLFTDMDPYWSTFMNTRCIDKISSCVFLCVGVWVWYVCVVCVLNMCKQYNLCIIV
jgi:hypothetical protein